MKRFLALLAALPCAWADEAWELYYTSETHATAVSALVERVKAQLPQGVELRLRPLPADCHDTQTARRHERAIASGVRTLPCLVLRDARGAYAALQAEELSPERIEQGRHAASAPERDESDRRRKLAARVYYQRALWQLCRTPAEQQSLISAWQEETHRENADEATRQCIGYYCLYPALMQLYAAEYKGSHTPRSEALLLQAISAIENVRDAAPESRLGKLAYDEREKLRAARLKSRQYE